METLLKYVEVEEEDVKEELICAQGAKKRVKVGHGYLDGIRRQVT